MAKANAISRLTLLDGVVLLGAVGPGLWLIPRSSYVTGIHVPGSQTVPFSHEHHVGDDGTDYRHCHTVVLFFMRVWFRGKLTWVFVGANVLWLAFLIIFTVCDAMTRPWIPVPRPWTGGALYPGGPNSGGPEQ